MVTRAEIANPGAAKFVIFIDPLFHFAASLGRTLSPAQEKARVVLPAFDCLSAMKS
jgi:hypothetical protein